jgi:retron-type reverse transcriptase
MHSYGFRPGRNAHQALQQSLKNINSGYQDILDIDLKSLFIIPYFEWYSLVRRTSLVLR